jgi:hypothetical protein
LYYKPFQKLRCATFGSFSNNVHSIKKSSRKTQKINDVDFHKTLSKSHWLTCL